MSTNPKFRGLYVLWAFFEIVLFGGLHFGWGSLVYVLKKDGVFADLCSPRSVPCGNGTADVSYNAFNDTNDENELRDGGCEFNVTEGDVHCPAQDERLALIFALGSGLFCVGVLVMGRINFQFGTRKTRLCALVTSLAGCFLTGFTSKDNPWCILPGIIFLGIGGIPLLVTNVQLSVLFSTTGAAVVGILNGAYDASAGFIPLMVKLLHDKGVALRWSMVTVAGFYPVTLVSTFCCLPSIFISKTDIEVTYSEPSANDKVPQDQKVETMTETTEVEAQEKKLPSLKSCLLSPFYLLHLLWACVLQLRFYYFLGSVNTWLQDVLSTDQEVNRFTDALQYTIMCSLLVSPLVGWFYDLCKRPFAASNSKLSRDLMPAVLPLSIGSLLGILLSALALFRAQAAVYLSFIVFILLRSFLFSIGSVFLITVFPSEYLGLLHGLMIFMGGVAGLLQYGLYAWAGASGYTVVNGVLIAVMATSLVHPIYLWFTCRCRPDFRTANAPQLSDNESW